nr:hypothetical protein [Tanacetum cinerariifolium]
MTILADDYKRELDSFSSIQTVPSFYCSAASNCRQTNGLDKPKGYIAIFDRDCSFAALSFQHLFYMHWYNGFEYKIIVAIL